MNNKINDLGVDTNIEDYLVKLVYYKKNTDESNTIGFNELISKSEETYKRRKRELIYAVYKELKKKS